MFYENKSPKANYKNFIVVKVIRKKGDKLSVKWKDYGNYFNSWIDKRDTV